MLTKLLIILLELELLTLWEILLIHSIDVSLESAF